MQKNFYREDEDYEDYAGQPRPETSVSGRPPNEDLSVQGRIAAGQDEDESMDEPPEMPVVPSSNPVFDRIKAKQMLTSAAGADLYADDPLMQNYEKREQDLEGLRQAQAQANFNTNIGQAAATIAQGSNKPMDSSGFFKTMSDQNAGLFKGKENELDRRQKIMAAIENRKMRQGIETDRREDRKFAEAGRREDRNLVRKQIAATRELARSDKQEKEAEKRSDKELSLAVPGYERSGEVLVKPEDAGKLRSQAAMTQDLSDKLKRMKQLVKDNGPFEYFGKAGAEMDALATEIQLMAKSPEMFALGVLTGPDMKLLEKITASPSDVSSFFTMNSTRQKQLDTQLASIESKLANKAKSMGYKSAVGSNLEAEQGARKKNVARKLYSPSRNQTKIIYDDGTEEMISGR